MIKNERIEYIDTLKGLLIIFVILGHTDININIQKWIYSFHMPIFIIISGLFFKENKNLVSIKRVKRLLYPFCIYIIFAIIFPGIPKFILKDEMIEWSRVFYMNERIYFNTPIWFLIVLFFIEVELNFITKILRNKKYIILFLIFLQVVMLRICPILPLGIRLSLAILPTFYIGILLKKRILILSNINMKNNLLLLLLLLSFFLSYLFGIIDLYKMKFSNNLLQYYILTIFNCFLWIEISKKIEKIKWIKILGKNTIFILGSHYYILFILRHINKLLKVKLDIKIVIYEGIVTILLLLILILIKDQLIKYNKKEVIYEKSN